MAGRGQGIRAGRAFVTLTLHGGRAFASALDKAGQRLRRFGGSVTMMGRRLALLGGAASIGFGSAVKEAMHFTEILNQVDLLFGKNANAMNKWADETGSVMKRSKLEMRQFMIESKTLADSMELVGAEAIEMTKFLTTTVFNFASQFDKEDAEMMELFGSALSGSARTAMLNLKVNIYAAHIDKELEAMGIDPKTATAGQKVQARLSSILKQRTKANEGVGDALRTMHELTGQIKSMTTAWSDAKLQIGLALIPILTPIVGKIRKFIEAVGDFAKKNNEMVVNIAKAVAAITVLGLAMVTIGLTISTIGFVLQGLGLIAAVAFSGVGIAVAGTILALYKYTTVFKDLKLVMNGFVKQINSVLIPAFQSLKDAFEAENIELQTRILWHAIKSIWGEGIARLDVMWTAFKKSMTFSMIDMQTQLVTSIEHFFPFQTGGNSAAFLKTLREDQERRKGGDGGKQDDLDDLIFANNMRSHKLAKLASDAALAKKATDAAKKSLGVDAGGMPAIANGAPPAVGGGGGGVGATPSFGTFDPNIVDRMSGPTNIDKEQLEVQKSMDAGIARQWKEFHLMRSLLGHGIVTSRFAK